MKAFLLGAVLCTSLLAACSSQTNTQDPKDLNSLQGEWNIAQVKGESFVNSNPRPFIGFDIKDMRLYGKATCNNIMSQIKYDKEKDVLSLGPVASTMMMCPDLDKEQIILHALDEVKSFDIEGDNLYLVDSDNTVIFELSKQ